MIRRLLLSLTFAAFIVSGESTFAQTAPVQQHITQSIIVNGQQVRGVLVVENGAIQSQTCPTPQQYVTADQSSGGWACFDSASGTWLLHALPPVQAASSTGQTPVYVESAPTYAYYPYAYGYYPYPYYPYAYYPYPYYYGPTFGVGVGFGFGFRGPFVGRPFVPFGRPGGVFVGRPVVGRVGVGRVGRR